MAYTIPNNDRTALIRQLQQVIRRLDLIDTFEMIETIRIETRVEMDASLTLVIVGQPYYRYLDSMSESFKSNRGRRQTVGFPMTRNWLDNSEVRARFASVGRDYFRYLRKTFPMLNFEQMQKNFNIKIDFNDILF